MIVHREWVVCCRCPDCGEPMPVILRIQEQEYPSNDSTKMPDQSYMSPSMIMSGSNHLRCSICNVTHDPARVEPILQQVTVQQHHDTT